jgi:hypothetical protein
VKYPPNLSQSIKQTTLGVVAMAFTWSLAASAHAQTSFFQGKTITIIQGRDPGGSGDLRTKALVPFCKNIFQGIQP